MADLFSDNSWIPAAVSLAGGLLGSQSTNSSQSATRSMDPRLDRYVYGADGQSGLLGGAWGLMQKQAAQGGLNDLQRQGMEMQRQYLMSPQYQNSYGNMMSAGQSLMGGGVAGNPFTSQQPTVVMYGQGQQQWPQQGYGQPPASGSGPDAWGTMENMPTVVMYGQGQQPAQQPPTGPFQYDNSKFKGISDTYFAANPDVAKAFEANNYGLTRDQFAQTHFDKFGRSEGREAPYVGLPNYASQAPGLLSPANQQVVNQVNAGAANGGGGRGGDAAGNGGGFSIGVGQMTDAINSSALSAAQKAALLGLPAAAIAGLYSQYTASHGFMDAINQAADPIGALAAAQGWTDTDPGYNAWGGGYSDGGGGWGNGGYGFGGGTGGMGD